MNGAIAKGSNNGRNIVPVAVLCTIAALLLAFFVVTNPRMVEARAKAQAQAAEEISRENSAFCERQGLPTGARGHGVCTQELDEIRARHEKRIYESYSSIL